MSLRRFHCGQSRGVRDRWGCQDRRDWAHGPYPVHLPPAQATLKLLIFLQLPGQAVSIILWKLSQTTEPARSQQQKPLPCQAPLTSGAAATVNSRAEFRLVVPKLAPRPPLTLPRPHCSSVHRGRTPPSVELPLTPVPSLLYRPISIQIFCHPLLGNAFVRPGTQLLSPPPTPVPADAQGPPLLLPAACALLH